MSYEDCKPVPNKTMGLMNQMTGNALSPPRPSVASQYMSQLCETTARVQELTDRLYSKLLPFSNCPIESPDKNATCTETWPDYFTELRSKTWAINRALDTIEDAIQRCEL